MTVTSLFTDMAGNTPFLTVTVFVTANDHMIVGSIYNYLSITHSITFLLITSTFTHCHLDFL